MIRLLQVAFLCSSFVVCSLSAATAQDPDLDESITGRSDRNDTVTAELETVPRQHRNGACYFVSWTLRWTGREIIRGRLEYTVDDHQGTLGEFQSEEIVLSRGERQFTNMLPALHASDRRADLTIQAQFVTEKRTFNLRDFPLQLPHRTERILVLGYADAWGAGAASGYSQLEQSLQLERFHPDPSDTKIATVAAPLAVNNFSENPLAYCTFDMLLLADEGFERLRERQLRAILKWVRAGGSVIVLPGNSLAKHHVTFLNDLIEAGPDRPPLLLDDASRLAGLPEGGDRRIILAHSGLGRTAVVLESEPRTSNYNSAEWIKMVWFLWKGRTALEESILRDGKWTDKQRVQGYVQYRTSEHRLHEYRMNSYGPLSMRPSGWLLDRLPAESIEMMPLSVMGIILLSYVVVVGPVDYIFLGLLRLRRFTWLLFPLVTVAFAAFTIYLAGRYMAVSDDRRAAVFLDVLDDGSIARENRIELLLMNSHRTVARDVQNSLFTPLEATFNDSSYYDTAYQQQFGTWRGFALNAHPTNSKYVGRIPAAYRVTQTISKWTPQLNRVFAIDPEGLEADFDWSSISPAKLADPAMHRAVYQRLKNAFSPNADQLDRNVTSVYVFHLDEEFHIGGPELHSQERIERPWIATRTATGDELERINNESFLYQLCVRKEYSMFSLVSQLSPAGGDNFEDFPILDPTDSRQWLLVVATRRGPDLVFYRKLYRGDG